MKLVSSLAAALAAAACLAQAAWAGTILRTGSQGSPVTTLQQYLHANQRADMYGAAIDGAFGPLTKYGLAYWQKRAGYRPTGTIATGSRQWNQLRREATVQRLPSGIDARSVKGAAASDWSVDASKTTSMLYLLHYDSGVRLVTVALATPTSFGGCNSDGCYVTPDGAFPVCRKAGRNEVSHKYMVNGKPAPMPWSLYFDCVHGVAVHQDPLGNSHECVHIPSMADAEYVYRSMPIGALVVVHG